MKKNEFGNYCFEKDEIIKVKGKNYQFKKTIPNQPQGCALYATDGYIESFCAQCGGCGCSFPKGTVRGCFIELPEQAKSKI